MYGGILHNDTIVSSDNYLLAAFAANVYQFNILTQLCEGSIDLPHQQTIISLVKLSLSTYKSLDQSGKLVSFQIKQEQGNRVVVVHSQIQIKNWKAINKGYICHKSGNVFFIEDRKLRIFNSQSKEVNFIAYQHNCEKILQISDSWLFVLLSSSTIACISLIDSKPLVYEHSNPIMSATYYKDNLIIGDTRGKIIIVYNFLSHQPHSLHTSKLQWHTAGVRCLKVLGQYLYSGGEEGVIVLWHLRDFSRDFLPRIGTAISSISLCAQTNEIICGLSDNSICMINLGNDKQLKTFRTIVDPHGYCKINQPRFTTKTLYYNSVSDELILNALPGQLQSLNFSKNAENMSLQVIPRNLISKLDKDVLKPHIISSFCLNSNSSALLVCISEQVHSSIKFYGKQYGRDYQLICKIQNPHTNSILGCHALVGQKCDDFVTFSNEVEGIKIWSQIIQKKKSISEGNQIFWKCKQSLGYRGMKATALHSFKDSFVAIFQSSSIVYFTRKSLNFQIKNYFNFKNQSFKSIYILQTKKDSLKMLAITINEGFRIWDWDLKENAIHELTSYKGNPSQNIDVIIGDKQVALLLKTNHNSTEILIFELSNFKFVQSLNCSANILTGFWKQQQLIVISSDMMLQSVDGNPFINYKQKEVAVEDETNQMEQEMISEDIFGLSKKWVSRQRACKKKSGLQTVTKLHMIGSCSSGFEQFARKILI